MSEACVAKENVFAPDGTYEVLDDKKGCTASGLILTADKQASEGLPLLIAQCGLEPACLGSLSDLQATPPNSNAALLLCEENLPDGTYRDALRIIRRMGRRIPVIVFSRIADWENYLEAVRLGAYDCLRYPFRNGELRRIVDGILRTSRSVFPAKRAVEPPR